jgi:hypothetical protein
VESEGTADRTAAAAQLAALQAGRAQLAERAVQPWWYDALLGLMVFGLFASYSLRSTWATLAAVVLFLLGVRGLMAVYQRITGFWVNGLRPGRTQRAIRVWWALSGVVLAAGFAAEYLLDRRGAMVVAGAVLGVGIVLISRWWAQIYVTELREEL